MLILTRKVGEGVMVGPNIRVVVLEINGGQARLGIHAPATMAVHRDEIAAKIRQEQNKEGNEQD